MRRLRSSSSCWRPVVCAAAILTAASATALTNADPAAKSAAVAVPAPTAAALERALALVNPAAESFALVPCMKDASDRITACLEGMDRANLLVGSRPIGQLKSLAAVNVAVDDLGALAIVDVELDEKDHAAIIIVPVTDAAQFLEANFKPGDEAESYVTANGRKVFAKPLARHVVLGENAAAVRQYDPQGGAAQQIRTELGERGWAIAQLGDAIMWSTTSALLRVNPQAARLADSGVKASLVALNFDPLAMIVRNYTTFDPASELGRSLAARRGEGSTLTNLPAKPAPFFFAGAVDVQALGGPQALAALSRALILPSLPEWAAQADAVQFVAYPSPAGLQGGILNDAVVVMQADQPEQARAALKDWMLKSAGEREGVQRTVQWTDNKQLKSGDSADAYEIAINAGGANGAAITMVQTALVGSAGWRGFVKPAEQALVVTFSQRPAVLREALRAANGEGERLDSHPVINALRHWLPARRDAELYIGVGPLVELAAQLAATVGMGNLVEGMDLAGLDPVAFGLEAHDQAVESALVLPASVLAFALDLGMRMQLGGMGAPLELSEDNRPQREAEPRP